MFNELWFADLQTFSFLLQQQQQQQQKSSPITPKRVATKDVG
jgi:hypothetical protein